MEKSLVSDDTSPWVRLHVIVLLLIVCASVGMVIIDARLGDFVERGLMSKFRTVLFLSVLSAGIGARALLARKTATVDTQGWVFLVLVGLLFLAVAAYGFADCYYDIREAYERVLRGAGETLPT